ncbi:MAG TPA: glycine--tRNA ligase [Candidatus Bathyarchaeia archaeon]|nr:glycine--tRNA ligase [Candidatus Bathyarchaeia archaeon]
MQVDQRKDTSIEGLKERVLELARRRGFLWPSYEIYGGVAGLWDYGPYGAMLKHRVESAWRDIFIVGESALPIDTPTIGVEDVFLASGHLSNFVDLIVECVNCHTALRADHVVAEYLKTKGIAADLCDPGVTGACVPSREKTQQQIDSYSITCPDCGGPLGEVRDFNLMFVTQIGPGTRRKGYLRPETAQGIFADFPRLLRFYRDRLPFGVAQIGRSYRNEISPRQGVIRLREFTQAEVEIFVDPRGKNHHPRFGDVAGVKINIMSQNFTGATSVKEACERNIIAHEYLAYHIARCQEFFTLVGVDESRLRFRQHLPDEMAHYAVDCWDAEGLTQHGWVELAGIADRSDYDLKQHERQSGLQMAVFVPYNSPKEVEQVIIRPNMQYLGPRYKGKAKQVADFLGAIQNPKGPISFDGQVVDPEAYSIETVRQSVAGELVTPHVIEPSFGIDRSVYTVLEHAYDEDMIDGERRIVLRLSPDIAPVEVAVFPLVKAQNDKALEVFHLLRREGLLAEYDDSGTIGRRYRRQDEIGTPFAVTIDHETLENSTVTIRDRDTTKQVRHPIESLAGALREMLAHGFFAGRS